MGDTELEYGMLHVPPLPLPECMPELDAIRSWGDDPHGYEPEFWELQYKMSRYLGRITDDALNARYRAISRNMRSLVSPDRHMVPIQSFLSSWYWYRKEHQTRLEFAMRHSDLRDATPDIDPGVIASGAPARPRFPNSCDVLFRYGQRTYLEPMVSNGHIRLNPASFYESVELGEARMDEERFKYSYIPGEHVKVATRDGVQVPIKGDLRRTVSTSDYYALCLSCDWDTSLFSDFKADVCVVVRQPTVFTQRLHVAGKEQLEGWDFHHNPIEYFDPYELGRHQQINAWMHKDFRFAYQREFRCVWINSEGREAGDAKDLDLGPLDDIAEIHAR